MFVKPEQNTSSGSCESVPERYTDDIMAKETTLKEIGEMLSFVVEHMATKDDIADVRKDMATKGDIKEVEVRVTGKIDKVDATIERVDSKLGAFEDHEVDKRKQLEVRVLRVEQKL